MVEQKFPISKSGYTVGKLMDAMECQIFLDTGASKSFMSKSYYNFKIGINVNHIRMNIPCKFQIDCINR